MKTIMRILAAAVLLLLAAGCATKTSASGPERVVTLSPSWAEAYPTVQQTARNANAIALITVRGTQSVEVADGAVYTNFNADVTRWVTTSSDTPRSIIVRQMGGKGGSVTYVVDDDPLLQPGQEQLVFLRQFSPGHYVIQGGPTGRLTLSGTQLRALPTSAMAAHFPAPTATTLSAVPSYVATGPAKSRVVS